MPTARRTSGSSRRTSRGKTSTTRRSSRGSSKGTAKRSSRKSSRSSSSGASNRQTKVTNMPPQLKAWTQHLNKYRKDHPNEDLRTAMKKAAKTYKK